MRDFRIIRIRSLRIRVLSSIWIGSSVGVGGCVISCSSDVRPLACVRLPLPRRLHILHGVRALLDSNDADYLSVSGVSGSRSKAAPHEKTEEYGQAHVCCRGYVPDSAESEDVSDVQNPNYDYDYAVDDRPNAVVAIIAAAELVAIVTFIHHAGRAAAAGAGAAAYCSRTPRVGAPQSTAAIATTASRA
jgi:hypothetical protein